jgi:enoyl-CoA hydratase/carnithine racemase
MGKSKTTDLVQYACKDGIAEITLNRPEKLNAINDEFTVELRNALRLFDADKSARVGILYGNGKAFSTGADVKQRQMRTRDEYERFGGPQHPDAHAGDLITRSVNYKPLIAAVHGHVMGLAVGITLECELVVAEKGTRFQITETPRGLGGARYWAKIHFAGCTTFATEVALTGRFFDADEAHNAGLICRVAKAGEHVTVARELAAQIASNPPLSVQQTVRARRLQIENLERQVGAHTDLMRLYLTEDFETSVKAYLNKEEKPEYKGR